MIGPLSPVLHRLIERGPIRFFVSMNISFPIHSFNYGILGFYACRINPHTPSPEKKETYKFCFLELVGWFRIVNIIENKKKKPNELTQ